MRRRDVEQWMSHRLLPENMRERVRRYEHYMWQDTRGADEHNLLHNLPKDLHRDIKRHLCLVLLMRVSFLLFCPMITFGEILAWLSIHCMKRWIDKGHKQSLARLHTYCKLNFFN